MVVLRLLKDGERIDDLQIKGLKIIQDTQGFCFGIDAVLLSSFAKVKTDENVIDLGTGTGIIPLLLSAKTKAKIIYGIDIQEEVVQMANRSIILNNLGEKIKIINQDLKKAWKTLGAGKWDVVVSNPPYMINNSGLINKENKKAISRHEINCTMKDLIECANKLLKVGGRIYLVHRPERLSDIFFYMREYKLEPKTLRFVHPNWKKAANIILIEGIRNAKPGLKMLPSLYVYDEEGKYTQEINRIYGRED